MSSLRHFTTTVAATKRAILSGGKSTGYVTVLPYVRCMALMPVDAETRQRPALSTFHEVKETFVESGLNVQEGDVLVINSVEYPVRAVEEWPWRLSGDRFLRLIVEELKR